MRFEYNETRRKKSSNKEDNISNDNRKWFKLMISSSSKMYYLFIYNKLCRTKPIETLLAVNTFKKDTSDFNEMH
jgi:hypothetical protein